MEDINQLELAAYILIVSNEITLYKDKTILNYLDLLKDEMIRTKKNMVFNKIKLSLFNNFGFRASLNYFHREFDDTDVIKTIIQVYNQYSVRTAKEEVDKLDIITNK